MVYQTNRPWLTVSFGNDGRPERIPMVGLIESGCPSHPPGDIDVASASCSLIVGVAPFTKLRLAHHETHRSQKHMLAAPEHAGLSLQGHETLQEFNPARLCYHTAKTSTRLISR